MGFYVVGSIQYHLDLTSTNQQIFKSTINDLIVKQELPATATNLIITTPTTSCIYFSSKIHKPNNPGLKANVKQFSVNTSSARRSSVSELGSLTVRKSKKCLRAKRPSPCIRDDGIKRCNIHSENKFAFAQEIEIAKNLKRVLTVLNVWR